MYDDIVEETGYDKKALQNIKSISDKVETSRRREELSFSHHSEVASLPRSTRSTRTEQDLIVEVPNGNL